MNFGENLKRIRKSRGLSQAQLGEKVGRGRSAVARWECTKPMDASHIRRIENSKTSPTVTTVERIAEALDCTVSELFGEEPQVKRVGRWEVYQLKELGEAWTVQCSVCKAIGFHGKTPFCPECGARME